METPDHCTQRAKSCKMPERPGRTNPPHRALTESLTRQQVQAPRIPPVHFELVSSSSASVQRVHCPLLPAAD
jgi:hypothetical protein